MKLCRIGTVSLLALSALTQAQCAFILNFNELGNGSISLNGGAFQPFNGSLIQDPSSTSGSVLAYDLNAAGVAPVVNGDVLISEPAGGVSDVLRFTDATGSLTGNTATLMIFYSLSGGGFLADTGLPSNAGSGSKTSLTESGGAFQLVAAGSRVYNGVSDIPEPSALSLLALGFGGLGLARRRQRGPIAPQ